MAWAIKQEAGDPASRLLLLILANYADESGKAWPSMGRLERETGMSRSSVIRKLAWLEEAGFLSRTLQPHPDGSFGNNVYTLGGSVRVTPPPVSEGHQGSVRVTPKPISEPINASQQGPLQRLPDDWAPADPAWAPQAYPNMEHGLELEKFTDHFRANGERRRDWDACWRNWIRRAATFHRAPVLRPKRLSGAELDARNAASLRASLDALHREGSQDAPRLGHQAGQGRPARAADGS